MNQKRDRFPVDPKTCERREATYRVYLCVPSIESGYVDVKAMSESEAAQTALNGKQAEIHWKWTSTDDESLEVFEIECLEGERHGD